MRAIVREILARRMPGAPEEFVALQISRLNEALLVAYSAMSGQNLRAVDRVATIVREFDRYHGFVAVERRSVRKHSGMTPEIEAKAEEPLALLAGRLRTVPQALEKAVSAPGNYWTPNASGEAFALPLAAPARDARAPEAVLIVCAEIRKWRRKRLKRLNPRQKMTGPRPPRTKVSPPPPARRTPRARPTRHRSHARKRCRKRLKKLNSRPRTAWRTTRRTNPSSRPFPRRRKTFPRTRRYCPGKSKFRCEMAWAAASRRRGAGCAPSIRRRRFNANASRASVTPLVLAEQERRDVGNARRIHDSERGGAADGERRKADARG